MSRAIAIDIVPYIFPLTGSEDVSVPEWQSLNFFALSRVPVPACSGFSKSNQRFISNVPRRTSLSALANGFTRISVAHSLPRVVRLQALGFWSRSL